MKLYLPQINLIICINQCMHGLDKGQKWYGPNRSRRYLEEVVRIPKRTVEKKKKSSGTR